MKYYLPIIALLVSVALTGCPGGKCNQGEVEFRLELSPEALSWLPPDGRKPFFMRNNDSITETWNAEYAYRSFGRRIDNEACYPYDAESERRAHTSNLNGWQFHNSVEMQTGDLQLGLNLRGFIVTYNLRSANVIRTQTPSGIIEPDVSVLDSFVVNGVTYTDVLLAENDLANLPVVRFWYGRGVGLLRFEDRNGEAWWRVE